MFVNTNAAISVRHLDLNLPAPLLSSWNDWNGIGGGQLRGIIFFTKSALISCNTIVQAI